MFCIRKKFEREVGHEYSYYKKHIETRSSDCFGSSGKFKTYSMRNDVQTEDHESIDAVSFLIEGMICNSCANKIEKALLKHSGVSRVFVDLAERYATIHFDPDTIDHGSLKSAIEAVGYTATQRNADVQNNSHILDDKAQTQKLGPYPFFIGIAAALAVVGFYLGLQTLTSDWYNAKMQFIEYRWWIIALSLGLGTQVTLFALMRKKLYGRNITAAKSGLAASGGMSTASMAARCAHYLVPLMPTLGLPFLSGAVAGIARYQTELFMIGVLSNLFGLGIMLRIMYKNGILILKYGFGLSIFSYINNGQQVRKIS